MKKFTNLFIKNNVSEANDTPNNIIKKKPNGFCLLKPGFVDHEDEFCDILNKNGWEILNKKRIKLTPDQASTLYVNLEDKPFYPELCDYMSSDDCLCCSCINEQTEDPIGDMKKIKDKVRDMWGETEMKNAMHSSDSQDNVERETALCFCDGEKEIGESIETDKALLNDFIITQQVTTGDELTNAPEGYLSTLMGKLKKAVAEEWMSGYFYRMTSKFIVGIDFINIESHFDSWFVEEIMEHTRLLLERINQIGTLYPEDINPDNINILATSNGHKYIAPRSLDTLDICQTAITMEHYAIETYKDLEFFTRGIDPVTNQLAKHLLEDEIKHETMLRDYLENISSLKCNTYNN